MITVLRRSPTILVAFLLVAITASIAPPSPVDSSLPDLVQEPMPDGLMSAFLEASSQPFAASADAYHARSGGLDVTLDASGLHASLGDLTWRLALRAWGREEGTTSIPEAEIAHTVDRLEYRRGTLTEWYRDTAMGVEQGFTLHQPPPGAGPLVLHLALSTDLDGVADADARGLSFTGLNGQTLRYDHLRAWDAGGMPLEAQLSHTPDQVAIQVNDRGATYPITIDPLIYREHRVLASNGMPGDRFGYSVALWGDTALVGSTCSDVDGSIDRGAVYVFVRSGATWTQQARLAASDGEALDGFGSSVALSADTALVGAPGHDVGVKSDQGTAYVFTRSGTTWTEQAQLTASDGDRDDLFGHSVALSGDTALVGAYLDDLDLSSSQQGSAYIFARSGTTWSEQAHLVASDGTALDRFGYAVALSGDTALVGAFYHTVDERAEQGAAYIFARSGTIWSEQTQLIASDGEAYDHFGNAVALWNDTALIGASHDDLGAGWGQGSAYVFTQSGAGWSEQAHLVASDGTPSDYFGHSVVLWGDTALIGAPWDLVSGQSQPQGSAYVYRRSETAWSEQAHLIASDGSSYDEFGESVALWGDTALVGAPSNDSAYVHARNETTWDEQQQLAAPSGWYDNLGSSVALWENTALVGACFDDVGGNIDQGSVYVFVWNGKAWSEQGQLTASDGGPDDQFGWSVALWGDTALVGAPYHDVGASFSQGSAYVFTRSGTTWTEQQKLTASDGAHQEYFAGSVSLWDDTALVGASGHDVGAVTDQGSAYVFTRTGTTWSEQEVLTATNGMEYDVFGRSVALWGDTALVGAPYSDVGANYDQGSAYVFTRSGSTWSEQAQLTASDGTWSDQFGSSVALWGNTALVGAYIDTVGENAWQGSAYVFAQSGTIWSEQARFTDPDGETGDYYGASVAVWGNVALVGAPGDDSADVYTRSGTTWSTEAHLTAWTGGYRDGFGSSVALWGNTALVGAPRYDLGLVHDLGAVYVYDALPVITSISRAGPDPTHALSVSFAVTYSEEVTGVDTADFVVTTTGSLSGATVTGVTGSGAAYTVTVSTGTGSGTLRLSVPSDATITDTTDNPLSSLPYTGEAYTVDALPFVTSITRVGPSPTNASSVSFATSFSEDVVGVGTSDFALGTTGSLTDAAITAVSGTDASYTVTVSTGTGSGTLRLDVPASATITDLTGNSLAGVPYNGGETYVVDKATPTVLSITRLGPSPTHAPNVDFAVAFSEAVNGVDASDFLPTTTGTLSDAEVSTVSGSGANYTVTVSTGTGNGTLRLDTPLSATIADLADNPLSDLPYTGGEIYTVDPLPYVTSIARTDPSPTCASQVGFAVTFSEDVTGVDVTDFVPTTIGSIGPAAVVAVSGSGATYTVTVSVGGGSGTVRLDMPLGTTVVDLTGNPLSGLPYIGSEAYVVGPHRTYLPVVLRTAR